MCLLGAVIASRCMRVWACGHDDLTQYELVAPQPRLNRTSLPVFLVIVFLGRLGWPA